MRKFTLFIFLLSLFLGISYVLPSFLASQIPLKEALYYQKLDNKVVQCLLCPRKCVIPDKRRGFCRVRENRGGVLYTLSYSQPCALHIDPVEKKPLFHFLPGTKVFSLATVGCNLRCKFCQNWQISQAKPEEVKAVKLTPQELIQKVKRSGTNSIAFTYTEPTIFYEYMLEIAKLAKKEGIKTMMHSNGFINPQPLRELCKYLDAANIDLKGFTPGYYNDLCQGELEAVLSSLKIIKEQRVWLEITNLVLPGLNDDPKDIERMSIWIRDNLGSETPLHFSRFWPMYKLISLSPTPIKTLEEAREIAKNAGLKFVYIGNVPGHRGENTFCPKCNRPVIERVGYTIVNINLKEGRCGSCGERISGVWK